MANHTGTINTSEVWLLADSPHYITGNVTVSSNAVLTIQAGCDVVFNGYYYLYVLAGTLVAQGTLANQIDFYSGITDPRKDSAAYILIGGNYSHILTYCNINHSDYGLYLGNIAGSGVNISNLLIKDSYNSFYITGSGTAGASWKISKSKAINCYYSIFSTGAFTNAIALEFEQCEFLYCVATPSLVTGSITLTLDRVLFRYCNVATNIFPLTIMTDCIFDYIFYMALQTITTHSITDCIFANFCRYSANVGQFTFGTSGDGTITTCDFINSSLYAVYGGGGLVNCYIAGCSNLADGASPDNIDTTANAGTDDGVFNTSSSETPQQFLNVDYVSGLRTTPNQAKTISAEASTPTDTTCLITFTSGRLGRTVVKYGTTSGNLNIQASNDETWSGYNGSTPYTRSHSITLQKLTKGTTYYYKCYNEDALGEWSASSVELSFTTTGLVAVVTNIEVYTDKINYSKGDTLTVTGTITVDKATTGTGVLAEIRKKSDNSLVTTLMNKTYNFVANTAATITTINGSALTWTNDRDDEQNYVKLTVSGGTPAIDATVGENIIQNSFYTLPYKATLVAMSIEGDAVRYDIDATATVSASVTLDSNTTNTAVLIEVRKESDDSLIEAILNTTNNFTADTPSVFAPTYVCNDGAADYYFKLTVSAGTPAIEGLATVSSAFVVRNLGATITYPVAVSVASNDISVEVGQT